MEKVTRRVLKRWNDDAQDHSELGAALNGFSLNESGSGRGGDGVGAPLLAGALERTWGRRWMLHIYPPRNW